MDTLIRIAVQFIFTIIGLILGICFGIPREKAHLRELDRREAEQADFIVTDLRTMPGGFDAAGGELVMGQVVIGSDYLKTFLSKFRNFFGGEMKSFERMLFRARREAQLRMVEEARRRGAGAVINVRIETSRIGQAEQRGGNPMAEILCYGTAVFARS
jgi:uncharacterized protein YbjQ (UPF0145 family)